jgi:hypothetical protein
MTSPLGPIQRTFWSLSRPYYSRIAEIRAIHSRPALVNGSDGRIQLESILPPDIHRQVADLETCVEFCRDIAKHL